jgi:hypothetical protein
MGGRNMSLLPRGFLGENRKANRKKKIHQE